MKRQIYLNEEVKSFGLNEVIHKMRTDLNGFAENLKTFSTCNISIVNSGLPIDRKLLYSWKQHGLLPYEKQKGNNWGRFSFFEICWLKLLLELRSVGIGLDKLKEIKDIFFPKDFIEQINAKANFDIKQLSTEDLIIAEEAGLIKNGKVQIIKELRKTYDDLQFSLFPTIVIAMMLYRKNYVITITASNNMDIIDLNTLVNDAVTELPRLYDRLSDKTCVMVNLKKIITDISGTEDIFNQPSGVGAVLSNNSIVVLKKLFTDNKVKEVTIRINHNGQPTVLVKRDMDLAELQKQIHSLNKKGNFKDIIVKTRNGNVQYFEQTEIFKL